MKPFLKTVIASGALALACAANADVVFSQAYDGTGALYASQNDTTGGNGNFATAFDDFDLSTATNLNGFAWTGGYYNPPEPAPISSFTISLYSDAGGAPGALFASEGFAGNANENCAGGSICTYSVSFPNFAVAAGTYWLAVVPDLGFPPQWGWATSATGTNNAYQCFLGECGTLGLNLAFDVMGTPVPEMETWALMLAGLGGLGLARRTRRTKASGAV